MLNTKGGVSLCLWRWCARVMCAGAAAVWCSSTRAVRMLREELVLLQQPGSHVAEVVRLMGRDKVLVKVRPTP